MRWHLIVVIAMCGCAAGAQEAADFAPPQATQVAPIERPAPAQAVSPAVPTPAPPYDDRIVTTPLPPAELTVLSRDAGAPPDEVWRDKHFRKLMKDVVPHAEFHYGRDMPLSDAMDMVMSGSRVPAVLRDGRYLVIGGARGPYLRGRGFVWVDLHTGEALGGFFFAPTNGEPTPTLAVFSRQITKENFVRMDELPPAFAVDLAAWTAAAGVPAVETRYFLSGADKRLLLQHTEDYCAPAGSELAADNCQEQNADAADIDVGAADYLAQVHCATNATAWMLSPEQQVFVGVRAQTCCVAADPFACRIRLDHARIRVIRRR